MSSVELPAAEGFSPGDKVVPKLMIFKNLVFDDLSHSWNINLIMTRFTKTDNILMEKRQFFESFMYFDTQNKEI